jgi:hypothetical protein
MSASALKIESIQIIARKVIMSRRFITHKALSEKGGTDPKKLWGQSLTLDNRKVKGERLKVGGKRNKKCCG